MATLPNWAVGRHITAVTCTPLLETTNTAGVVTLTEVTASNVTLYGHLKNIEIDAEVDTENLSPMNRTLANHVRIEDDFTVRVTEMGKASGVNLLASMYHLQISGSQIGHWKMVLTRGGQSFTMHALMAGYKMGAEKRGIDEEATFLCIDPGTATANPAYA